MILWFVVFGLILLAMVAYSVMAFGWRRTSRDLKKELARKFAKVEKKMGPHVGKDTFIEITNIFYFVLGELAKAVDL